MMNNSFAFCPNCNKLVFSQICPTCNCEISLQTNNIEDRKKPSETIERKESTLDEWVGPVVMDTPCTSCNQHEAYYMVLTPPSLDEPSVVRYKCANCKKVSSQYKN